MSTLIAICNYNTSALTNECISRILSIQQPFSYKMIILDNSDVEKFILNENNQRYDDIIQIIDNTTEKYVNFTKLCDQFIRYDHSHSHNGSFKHAASIQFLFDIITDERLLIVDSDAFLISPISFIDDSFITIADIQQHGEKMGYTYPQNPNKVYLSKTRFVPFIQFFNLKLVRQNKLKFFDPMRIQGGLVAEANSYDTGASFYEDVIKRNLSYKKITYVDYINHLGGRSWTKFDVDRKFH